MGFPKVSLSFEYFKAASYAPCAIPRAWAAIPILELSKAFIAIANPFPTSPSTFSLGTLQLSRIRVQVSLDRIPSLSSFFPILKPSKSFSMMKPVTPPCFFLPYSGSSVTLAKTTKRSAVVPLVTHIFSPFRIKFEPSSVALATIAAASVPDPASLKE